MKETYFKRVAKNTPTKFWINNVTREEAQLAIENGAVGCTQNPSYTWKMLTHPTEKEYAIKLLDSILLEEPDDNTAQIRLQKELVGRVAREYFLPMYEASNGQYGYVSIQGDPFREDVDNIVRYAIDNHEASPNIMAKIPVTADGLEAIEILASKGIAINATEVMAVRQAMEVGAAYRKGIKGLKNPAPIYYSHISGILDEYLQNNVKENNIDVDPDALWQAGIAAAKKTYQMTKSAYPELGFIGGGARGLQHFTEMVGADCVVTINWKGTAEDLILQDPPVVSRFLQPVPHAVIDELLDKIPDYERAYMLNKITKEEYEEFGPVVLFRTSFEDAWRNANAFIAERRKAIQ